MSILSINSCGDTVQSNISTESEKYFPISIGNYWVYQYYEYNIDGQQIGNTQLDSILVTEKINHSGKTAYKLDVYRNSIYLESMYIYKDESSAYREYDFRIDSLPQGLNRKIWQEFADFNIAPGSLWHIYDTTITNSSFEWVGKIYTGTKKITINSNYVDYSIRAYFGLSRYNLEFKTTYDQLNDLKNIVGKDTTTLGYAHKRIERINFIENIGIYEWMLMPSSYSVLINYNSYIPQYANGWHRQLIRYLVK